MENIKIISFYDLEIDEMRKIVEELIKLDYENISNLSMEDEGTLDQWLPIFVNNPDTWRILVYSRKIIGYWHFVPLKNRTYEKIKHGKIHEIDINEMDVKKLRNGGYKIYLRSMVLKKEFRDSEATNILFGSFFNVLEELSVKGIEINEMCAIAYTDDGKKLCKKFGMIYLGKMQSRGDIYYLKMEDMFKYKII